MAAENFRVRRVLIIGGGFAGLECSQRLSNDPRFSVTLVDKANHHVFQPLLYQVATASLAAPDIARSIRQILADSSNVTVFMDEVTAIDVAGKAATGKSGRRYEYDYLVVAAGARTSFFGRSEWEQHTMGLKTLMDAQNIRRTVLANLEWAELTDDEDERRKLMTVAIVGGGPTGVELAGAFSDLVHRSLRTNFRRIDTARLRVVLVEGSNRILETFDTDQSEYGLRRLTELGVEVALNTRVDDVRAGALHFADGTVLEAAAIIWAAGVEAQPITTLLGVPLADRGGRIAPLADLSVPGHPEIFVAGDLVRMKDVDDKPVPGVAPAATQMGKHIAKVLKEEVRLEGTKFAERKLDLRPRFRYLDKGVMAIIGKNHAIVKAGNYKLHGFIAWLAWLFIHIAFLIGFRNRLAVLLGWASSYISNEPEARIIANPPGTKDPAN
ncbi:MAG: NAD(P)/FAD-dependent oxidoreductase [Akkermansiaceae bacterium]|nr:NAD(P)/FAD-dependent oxidoreductase [Akkermansiaceae bacterium]